MKRTNLMFAGSSSMTTSIMFEYVFLLRGDCDSARCNLSIIPQRQSLTSSTRRVSSSLVKGLRRIDDSGSRDAVLGDYPVGIAGHVEHSHFRALG